MKSGPISILTVSLVLLALIVPTPASPVRAELTATFTVNAGNDEIDFFPGDGICETATGNHICTLRAAIMEANAFPGADTINLPYSTYLLTIPGADEDFSRTGDLDITESLTILGEQSDGSVIEATGLGDRVLHIIPSVALASISNVTIQWGEAYYGGGIASYAPLELNNVEIRNNHGDGWGGGIYSDAPLTIKNSTLYGNSAVWGGGGMVSDNSIVIENTLFTMNTADNGGGGALDLRNGSAQIIVSTFTFNGSEDEGGAILATHTILTMIDSNVERNVANIGGGIYNGLYSEVHIEGSTVAYNHANSDGGGLYVASVGNNSFNNVQIANNSAAANGGGIYNQDNLQLSDSFVYTNTAVLNGGGVYNDGHLEIASSVLSDNSAVDGAGIYNTEASFINLEGASLVSNLSSHYGGGLYNNGTVVSQLSTMEFNSSDNQGGAIYNVSAKLQLNRTTLSNNTAQNGGAIFNSGLNGVSGNIDLIDTNIISNTATLISGGIYASANTKTKIHDSMVAGNTSPIAGGGIYLVYGMMELDNVTISHNIGEKGGAIHCNSCDLLKINNSTISRNQATSDGGGIFITSGSVEIHNSTISRNQSDTNGGGIHNDSGLSLENTTISRNSSALDGGGIFNLGTVAVFNSTITDNRVGSVNDPEHFGGGIYNALGAIFSFRNTILFGNIWQFGDDDCNGTLTTEHFNLIGTLEGCSLANYQDHDLIGVDPLLGSLEYNSGPTETHALLDGSPAIDAANPGGCKGSSGQLLTTDQRSLPRYWDGDGNGSQRCDIGSYEYGSKVIIFLPITQK